MAAGVAERETIGMRRSVWCTRASYHGDGRGRQRPTEASGRGTGDSAGVSLGVIAWTILSTTVSSTGPLETERRPKRLRACSFATGEGVVVGLLGGTITSRQAHSRRGKKERRADPENVGGTIFKRGSSVPMQYGGSHGEPTPRLSVGAGKKIK